MSFRRLGLLLAVPTVVGLSLSACGTEDDAAPGPGAAGSGVAGGNGGTGAAAGHGGTGAVGGMDYAEGGMAGMETGPGGSGGDGLGGAGGDGPAAAGDGNTAAGAGGEAGAGTLGCRQNLQNFTTNPGGGIGLYIGDPAQTTPVKDSTVVWNSTQGSAAQGAGQLNATFGAYSEYAQIGVYLSPPLNSWTCTKKLHAMVKLVSATDLSHLLAVHLSVSSDNYGIYTAVDVPIAGFVLNTWKAIELNLATAETPPKFTAINGVGIQLKTVAVGTLPVATTMYVDDLWVE